MRNQTEKILRWLCALLAALVVWQLARAVFRATSLARVAIPAVPTLSTNEPSGGKSDKAKPAPAPATNAAPIKPGTNVISGTNTFAATNLPPATATNVPPAMPATNAVVSSTNTVAATNQTAEVATNVPAVLTRSETNAVSAGTNSSSIATNLPVAAGTNGAPVSTNPAAAKTTAKKTDGASAPPMTMGGGSFPRPGGPGGSLPPEVQPRVDKIVDSEIFAPVMRPQPMALMGIAGDVAFLRSPGGQTGLVKEGDSLGEIKLLRIGINRVLVEQDGQKKELTVFNGYGSESLLPKQNETSP